MIGPDPTSTIDWKGVSVFESVAKCHTPYHYAPGAVGKRLGKHFYVETECHHNAAPTENRAGGRVEYYIDPRWSVETFYGDANKGGIDLFWRKRFGRPESKRFRLPDESNDDRATAAGDAVHEPDTGIEVPARP